jgi:hypothetical protein
MLDVWISILSNELIMSCMGMSHHPCGQPIRHTLDFSLFAACVSSLGLLMTFHIFTRARYSTDVFLERGLSWERKETTMYAR